MKGYSKMPAIDFDTFNNMATVKANNGQITKDGEPVTLKCEPYTSCRPDANPDYVWVIVEHGGLTELPIVSEEEAINQGMTNNG